MILSIDANHYQSIGTQDQEGWDWVTATSGGADKRGWRGLFIAMHFHYLMDANGWRTATPRRIE